MNGGEREREEVELIFFSFFRRERPTACLIDDDESSSFLFLFKANQNIQPDLARESTPISRAVLEPEEAAAAVAASDGGKRGSGMEIDDKKNPVADVSAPAPDAAAAAAMTTATEPSRLRGKTPEDSVDEDGEEDEQDEEDDEDDLDMALSDDLDDDDDGDDLDEVEDDGDEGEDPAPKKRKGAGGGASTSASASAASKSAASKAAAAAKASLDEDQEEEDANASRPVAVFGGAKATEGAWAAADAAAGPGARRRAKMRERRRQRAQARGARARAPPPEARARIGAANAALVAGDLPAARRLLKEAVRLAPNFAEVWEALGTVASESGDTVRSLNYQMIAAHLCSSNSSSSSSSTPSGGAAGGGTGGSSCDEERWRRLARLSAEAGALRQAIYCLSKLLARARGDLDAVWDRAVLLAQVGEPRQALKGFTELGKKRPADAEVAKWIARCRHSLRDAVGSRAPLETLLKIHPGSVDLEVVNMLSELRLGAGENEAALGLISWARERFVLASLRMQRQGGGGGGEKGKAAAALSSPLSRIRCNRISFSFCILWFSSS